MTPKRRAVSGISCISPRAPLFETQRGLKSDSTWMTARTSDGVDAVLRGVALDDRVVLRAAVVPLGQPVQIRAARVPRCAADVVDVNFFPSALRSPDATSAPALRRDRLSNRCAHAIDGRHHGNPPRVLAPIRTRSTVDLQFEEGYFPPLPMLARSRRGRRAARRRSRQDQAGGDSRPTSKRA